jgi:hypothetical protein
VKRAAAVAVRPPEWEGELGAFHVDVRREDAGGALTLRPAGGEALVLSVRGDTLSIRWEGRALEIAAPGADLALRAKNVTIEAQETLALHGAGEVDVHSRQDVEIRADHHVNLWGHGVLVGD